MKLLHSPVLLIEEATMVARQASRAKSYETRKAAMSSTDPIVKSNDLWKDVNWFAIHAKPRRENFGATNLSALGIEILFPQVKIPRLTRENAQEGTKPLFPSYFFARFCPENALELVKAVRGVLQVVSSGRIPIPIEEKVVQEIQDRVQADGFIRIRPPGLAAGTRVTIQSGLAAQLPENSVRRKRLRLRCAEPAKIQEIESSVAADL